MPLDHGPISPAASAFNLAFQQRPPLLFRNLQHMEPPATPGERRRSSRIRVFLPAGSREPHRRRPVCTHARSRASLRRLAAGWHDVNQMDQGIAHHPRKEAAPSRTQQAALAGRIFRSRPAKFRKLRPEMGICANESCSCRTLPRTGRMALPRRNRPHRILARRVSGLIVVAPLRWGARQQSKRSGDSLSAGQPVGWRSQQSAVAKVCLNTQ